MEKHDSARADATIDGVDLDVDGERYRLLVIWHPTHALLRSLSVAERDVAERAARGDANRMIAEARGTSQRTVDHQLASIYRKLGIASRSELTALLGE